MSYNNNKKIYCAYISTYTVCAMEIKNTSLFNPHKCFGGLKTILYIRCVHFFGVPNHFSSAHARSSTPIIVESARCKTTLRSEE